MSDGRERTAVVSGASRGIGLEVARALIDDGYRVAMLARSADDLSAQARRLGGHAIPVSCDVSDGEAIRRATDAVTKAFGAAPQVVVNNAGFFSLAPVETTEVGDFETTIAVNLVAPFALVHAFVGAMRARGSGHIVSIGSIADRVAFPENAAYAASKFGLRAFHEVLRAELRGTGVRATLVSPGPVDTALWDEVDPDTRPGFTPRGSMLRALDVASAVRFAINAPSSVNVDELRLSRA